MQKTLMLGLDEAVREAALWEVDKPREEWLFGYPAELALLAGQVTDVTTAVHARYIIEEWLLVGVFFGRHAAHQAVWFDVVL